MTGKKVRFWSEVALGAMTVIVAVVFIVQVADIYYSPAQDDMYSRAIVAAKLKTLIAPVVIWLFGAAACFVLSVKYPFDAKKPRGDIIARVRKNAARVPGPPDAESDGAAEYNEHRRAFTGLEAGRAAIYTLAILFTVASAIVTIVYLARTSSFTMDSQESINPDIRRMVGTLLPLFGTSAALFIAGVAYEYFTAKTELLHITAMLKASKAAPISRSPISQKLASFKALAARYEERLVWGVRIAVFVVAVVFLALGISNDGVHDVFVKATGLCRECVGLG